jgi:hypothetical protein
VNGELEWQGVIIRQFGDYVLAQLFSWLDGSTTCRKLLRVEDLVWNEKTKTYRRLALACLSVRSDLMTIRKLRDESPGAIVEIFSRDVLVTLNVDGTWNLLSLFVHESLDSCATRLLLSEESPRSAGSAR